MMKLIRYGSLLVVAAMAAASQAVLFESEPNDNLASADAFTRAAPGPWADLAVANLFAGDVDYYSLQLYAGDTVTLSVTAVPFSSSFDTYMGFFDPSGTLLEADDDDGVALTSSIQRDITVTGVYYIALTGFGDPDFNGSGHTEAANYYLTASVAPVPEPATMTALGLGAIALIRRRKRA